MSNFVKNDDLYKILGHIWIFTMEILKLYDTTQKQCPTWRHKVCLKYHLKTLKLMRHNFY